MASHQQVNILLVDDREENILALEGVLHDLGENLVRARSGREALKHLLRQEFAVILLDVQMPEMNGFETATLIRSREKTRYTPIIFVTAINRTEAHVVQGYSVGAVDYIVKPFVPEVLRAKVAAFVELWRKTRELQDEIVQRTKAEEEVRKLTTSLEQRVAERTAELAEANQDLHEEMKVRRWTERELYRAKETAEANLQRLQELEKLRDDLTHMIVHDLRTPLTSIISGLHTLESMGELEEGRRECLRIAVSGGETCLGMVNDLLDISKMEAGSLKLHYEALRAQDLVDSALRQVEPLARDKDLTLQRRVAPRLPRLWGDEDKLRRTLVNLLANAVKFTPRKGTITAAVRLAERQDGFRFSVQDTGEGIPQEAFGRIFEKFGQVDDRKNGKLASTGLGLTFCKMAVEAHGGQIQVESELGKGSTFFFNLPRAAPAARGQG